MALLVGLSESSVVVDIIPPWFSMLISHLEDEEQAGWWP
jgi:hypothetical protein